MALIGTEGFDHYNLATDAEFRTGVLQWAFTNSPSLVTGRGGFGKALSMLNQGISYYATFGSTYGELYFGFAMLMGAFQTLTDKAVLNLVDTSLAVPQMFLQLNSILGTIGIWQAAHGATPAALVASSQPNAFNGAVFDFLEVHGKIDPTAGLIEVQVNGATVVSFSGNTQMSANGGFGALQFIPASGAWTIDDFRFNDTTTGAGMYPNNSWTGDLRVATLYPTANGTVSWTPLANANWQEVSEHAFDGDTSYNSTATNGDEDLFTMDTLPATITEIIAVQIVGGYRETDSAAHTLTQQLTTNSSDFAGASHVMTSSYQFVTDLFVINPDTAASWTLTEINTMLIGYKAVS